MSVRYRNFREIDIKDYDAVVVGAGLAGCVAAQQLSEKVESRVLLIEKHDHIGGCLYDEIDANGIRVSRFGAHVFHTDDKDVFDYVNRFCEWHPYEHHVVADWYGTYLPIPFNENSLELAFGKEAAAPLIQSLETQYGRESQVPLSVILAGTDDASRQTSEFLFRNIYQDYTRKLWGVDISDISKSVPDRVPVRLSRDDRFYRSAHQGVPKDGYTAMLENMIDDELIDVCLNTEAESVFGMEFEGPGQDAPLSAIIIKDYVFEGPIVFTGPVDELFLSCFGRLPYRSLEFAYETKDCEYALPCATVNCTVTEDYTRVTECKRIFGQECSQTTLVKEYPCSYDDPKNQIPLFPIVNDRNAAQHDMYIRLVRNLPNFFPLGRLAEYRYYDMDTIVASTIRAADDYCR